jgi:hypothetical protein
MPLLARRVERLESATSAPDRIVVLFGDYRDDRGDVASDEEAWRRERSDAFDPRARIIRIRWVAPGEEPQP